MHNIKKSLLFIVLTIVLNSCYSAGGGYSLHEESPWHMHDIEQSTDSRGQTTTVETRIVKPPTPGQEMAARSYGGYIPGTGFGSGSSHFDTPSNDNIRCVRMTSGRYAGMRICPRSDGAVPYVLQGQSPGENDDPYRQQVINNAAAIQQLQDCLASGKSVCQ